MDRRTDRQPDGQTDRRTDRILIARPRLHSMQRGNKNYEKCTGYEDEQVYNANDNTTQNVNIV